MIKFKLLFSIFFEFAYKNANFSSNSRLGNASWVMGIESKKQGEAKQL
jgi:hypothetical protein